MVYMGSKNRIAKDLLPFIMDKLDADTWYIEPFVGGCNMMDKVKHPKRLGADNNEYLIALLQYVQDGKELPAYIDREEYYKVKANPADYPAWYVGYVGFICSYSGTFFKGFAGKTTIKGGAIRDYQREKKNNLLKQDLSGIVFKCSSYDELEIPDNSVIYCDPPYCNTSGYKDKFDSAKFWDWVREKSKNNIVLISEYEAPDDFKSIWSKELSSSLSRSNKKSVEQLFIWQGKE